VKRGTERVVLVAGIGTSPAVLTETVWALAHQKDPVVPDEIFVITTKKGKADLKSALLSGKTNVWEQLKSALRKEKVAIDGKLVFTEHLVKVMLANGEEMEDLRTGDDNLLAADFMLRELRKYTEEPGTTVLCSIAGGRKTMSALLFSCMSLLGREQDKVYHVLIPPEYECGMDPPFFFPQKGVSHQPLFRGKPAGKKVPSSKIAIELFEVPFVRIRGWFQEKFKTISPSYRSLISKVQTVAPPAILPLPTLTIDAANGVFKIDGKQCKLSDTCFALLLLIAKGKSCQNDQFEALMKMASFTLKNESTAPKWFSGFRDSPRMNEKENGLKPEFDIVAHLANELRTALAVGGLDDLSIKRLVPKRGNRMEPYPAAKIVIVNDGFIADLLGHPQRD
jgi:CRISPR-associated protein (TIGR02584 family)